MSAYVVAHLHDVRMGEEIVSYIESIDNTIRPFAGRFIVHGGPKAVLEGNWPGDIIILAFPSRAAAEGWYASERYQRILPLRTRNSEGDVVIVDGVDEAHLATDIVDHLEVAMR